MATYRYYTTDLLTNTVLGELELYGVYMNRHINRAGNFTGTFRLTDKVLRNDLYLGASKPGRTAIFVERNDELIWGGIIWSRTYSDQSIACQLNCQTFESYFDHVVFEEHFIQQKINQEIIFQNMVTQLQGYVDIGMTIETPLPTTNIPRTVLIPAYEFHYGTDALTQLVEVDLGLEYTINAVPSGVKDQPDKVIKLGYPLLGGENSELHFDYPGRIARYWMPESGANGGAKFAVLGFGSGNKVARATAVNQNVLDEGYPGWWIVNQYPTIADLTILQAKVTRNAELYRIPVRNPTFELAPGDTFNSWNNLGDMVNVHIEDTRFPNGFDIQSRMIGWELSPPSTESIETMKFTIEGADLVE